MSAVADEELSPEFAFEIAYLLRERRTGKMKPFSGATEMQLFGYCNEVRQLPELHVFDGSSDLRRTVRCNRSEAGAIADRSRL
jgi:hypothetical protein